ncbi:MAG TPA: 16S rRNA (uracil(1498)-N(3))-methyltransferase [Mycobacteriales bacterium]|jgi:16S rRNA (uracil1498-N3)-methyltransferase|nr:16S rRNA (uracil(1498)-N(3))-methyltransferase [Mycobacteriales bacterium]
MTAPLFLAGSLEGDVLTLGGDEGRHAATVRRIQPGEHVDLGDGAGQVASCVVEAVAGGTLTLRVVARRTEPPPAPRLVVVQALAKGDRAEDAVEAMTEVGVDEVVPWAAARCVVRWDGERGAKARARWAATARAAAKQSRRAWVPAVAPLAATRDVAARLSAAALAVVLHEDAQRPLAAATVPAGGEVVVVVGPEGGIAEDELAAFGVEPYRLGRSVLRTSTAGVAAAAVLLSRTARWG